MWRSPLSTDYQKIRAENIDRYGWDTAVLDLLGQLYSERTHFIFELLANAEDAGATELTFELFEDRLEVRHDGRPFTEADVRGVCGVGNSAKADDLTKIGKFGIGFKSVYAYTRTPHIYSSGECFRIENYVRPFPADAADQRQDETLFVFPFDHDSVPAALAVAEIAAALNQLEAGVLLFLTSVRRVQTSGTQIAGSDLDRSSVSRTSSSRHVTLANRRGHASQEWFVWHRQLGGLGHPGHQVEVAFGVSAANGARQLVRCDASPLVVSFPTQKETFLGFLIQGPYRTTPARDNVPPDDPSNQALVRETAALLADVLTELRREDLLTVDVLQALPLDPTRFAPGTMFAPIFDTVRTALAQEQFIPLAGGGYGSAGDLLLAHGTGVSELLRPAQLGALHGHGQPLAFAHESITASRTPDLWQYLRGEIGIDEVTPEAVVGLVTSAFLQAQSDDWMARFYSFLYQYSALWREPRGPDEQPGLARTRPIIRLEDGSQVVPFDSGDRPAVYLPCAAKTALPTVRRAVADIPAARRFLEALGFTEPDLVAEVLQIILPRYSGMDVADLDGAQHDADLECVALALAEAPAGQRQHLMSQLRQTSFLVGENAATGVSRLMTPAMLYERTKELESYFDGNPDAWFAADGYGPWLAQLRGMGVRGAVTPDARETNQSGYVVIADEFARHERGLDGFDPGAQIDGLDFALGHPNHARSEYVWNVLLVANRHLVAGVVERSAREAFVDSSRATEQSAIGIAATTLPWLPGPNGTFCQPAELRPQDLPPTYQRDEELASALGMVQSPVEEASRQLGIPVAVLRGLSEHPDLLATIEQELRIRGQS